MRLLADLQLHSRFSRAVSPAMNVPTISEWAAKKGIGLAATGDWTHPLWFRELEANLEEVGEGVFRAKNQPEGSPLFLLSTEVSSIYSQGGKVRKIHTLIFAPGFEVVSAINKELTLRGANLLSDGRPIVGLTAKAVAEIALGVSERCLIIPAHAWTPHFSLYGSVSGFDSIEECFEELTPRIYAIETGLSSDPAMNWRLSALDRLTLVSNSDAHSARKIGREANMFDTELSYLSMMNAIKTKKGFRGTIEFFPEEGKYHYDGHRTCEVSLSPKETIHHDYLCPVCGKKVTVGVMHRVEKLADRELGFKPAGSPAFSSIIPLAEIISETLKVGVSIKKVEALYFSLLEKLGNEFSILMDAPLDDIERAGSSLLREAIARVRAGDVHIAPGYDGEFGKVKIFEVVERKEIKGQIKLL